MQNDKTTLAASALLVTTAHLVRHTEGNYRIPAGLTVTPAPAAPGHYLLVEFPESIFGPANVPERAKSALRRAAENGEFYIDSRNVQQGNVQPGTRGARPSRFNP